MATVCEAKRGGLSVASGAVPTAACEHPHPSAVSISFQFISALVPERRYVLCRDDGLTLSFSLPHGAVSCKPKGAACLLESFSNYSMSSHISIFAQILTSLIKMVLFWGFSISNYRQVMDAMLTPLFCVYNLSLKQTLLSRTLSVNNGNVSTCLICFQLS